MGAFLRRSPDQSRLPRRRFLRGAGVALALPWLEAAPFANADDPARRSRAAPVGPDGRPHCLLAIQTNMGLLPQNFFPADAGPNYAATPYLQILEPFRRQMTVFRGTSHPDVDGAHEAEKSFLSAAPHPGSAAFRNSISLDQFAAEQLGSATRFSSFVLDVNAEGTQGMSFSRSGVKVPSEKSPAALFRRMFVQGNAAEVAARLEDLRQGRSLLDFVADDARRLQRLAGPADRARLEQYAGAVRDLEKQLQQAQAWERRPKPPAPCPEPQDIADNRKLVEKIRLMLQAVRLAFASDSTRVASLFVNTFSIVADIPGVKDETHSITHHGNRPENLEQLARIETAQLRELAAFLAALRQSQEAGGDLLGRTMVLYGAPMGSANSHANTNLPILLAGGGFRHAGCLAFDAQRNYPLPNLFLSLLQRLGLEVGKFASSTGTMRGLEFA